ncbi:MAG: diguanylate cyclase [Pseudomonadota bacterium]
MNSASAMPLWQIQTFGALVVADSACRQVHAVSDNLIDLLGTDASIAARPSLASLLGKRLCQRLRNDLQGRERLPVPLTFVRHAGGQQVRYQLHAVRSAHCVLIEIEALHSLGKQRLLGAVNEWLMHLADATHQQVLLDYLVAAIQQLTGHDRVVVCHFDSDWNGLIQAESRGGKLPTLLGQYFPASDFPLLLRRSYERHPVRYIPNVQALPVQMTFFTPAERLQSSAQQACSLDTTLVRAPSPSRVGYLQQLGVCGALNVAMQGDQDLWGMVICHSAANHPTPPPVRDAVRALVQMTTQRLLLLRARQEARFLQRVQDSLVLASTARKEPRSPQKLLEAQANTWMELFRADGITLWINGNVCSAGKTPQVSVINQWVKRLARTHGYSGPWCTRQLAENPLTRSLAMGDRCGALAMALPFSQQQNGWLLLFRPEQPETRYWAIRPLDPPTVLLTAPPSAARQQAVKKRSEAWQRVERLAAVDLGEDLTLAISSYEISQLNDHLERERKALASANQRLEQLAHFDPLTQVWNRYRIEQAIDAELVAAQRYGAQFGVLLFDVDHFKAINDTYGHALGDDVLVALAHQVEASLRGCDHLGRWGGEEFVVLARHADFTALTGLAERLRVLITTLHVEGLDTSLTVSVGVAAWQPEDSCKTLVARADQAMYRAKHAGRNRVEVAEGG